jgi:beta-galactosidase
MRKFITIFIITFLISPSASKAQETSRFFKEKDLVTTGIYYYPEHWDEAQWERDIKKIAEMGFEFVHLA